jgi:hypothetical protein
MPSVFGRHRVIVVTPAGRERYLRLLAAHVLTSPLVDEWHLWQNTTDPGDLAFMRELAAMHMRVRLIEPPLQPPNGIATIGQFFRTATARDAIYVRMDDDLVWLEPQFFPRFLAERTADREPLLVFPLIVNNAVCTWLLQAHDRVKLTVRTHPWCMDLAGWQSPEVAAMLHRWLLDRIRSETTDALHFGRVTASLARVSINCISWFGEDLLPFGGEFPASVDEEEFASVTLPLRLGLVNRITGQAICAHFAFYPQREVLDRTDLLEQYRALAPRLDLPASR